MTHAVTFCRRIRNIYVTFVLLASQAKHLTVRHGKNQSRYNETSDESDDDVMNSFLLMLVPLNGADHFPVVVLNPAKSDGNNRNGNPLYPSVGDGESNLPLGDVFGVAQRVEYGLISVDADQTQRQHGDDDEEIVGHANEITPRLTKRPVVSHQGHKTAPHDQNRRS